MNNELSTSDAEFEEIEKQPSTAGKKRLERPPGGSNKKGHHTGRKKAQIPNQSKLTKVYFQNQDVRYKTNVNAKSSPITSDERVVNPNYKTLTIFCFYS